MPKTHAVTRHDFVFAVTAFLGTIMGVVIGIPALGYLIAPSLKKTESEAWIPAGPLDNYPVNEPTLFSFTRTQINGWEKTVNSYGVFIIRMADGQVQALSNICTHLSCRVNWNNDLQEFVCPCHDGRFSEDGSVISGPPPRPLYPVETKVENGELMIYFKEGSNV